MTDDGAKTTQLPPRTPHPGVTESRRQVTTLFVDIADSTAFFSTLDPEDSAELVHALLEIVAEIVVRNGGTVDKFLGDGLMAKFGAPLAVEDAATRALRAALDIRENAAQAMRPVAQSLGWNSPLKLHLGLDTGLVAMSRIVSDDTAMGERVVAAARLMAKTAGDEILVGEETMRAARDEFLFESASNVNVGKTGQQHGTIPAFRLVAARRQDDALGTHRPSSTSLVGREEERRQIDRTVIAIKEGAHRVLLLSGDAGHGKTRLLVYLRSITSGIASLAIDSCREDERYAQYAPLLRLVRGWVDAAPEILGTIPAEHRAALLQLIGQSSNQDVQLHEPLLRAALTSILTRSCTTKPLVIVLDDTHWCDDATLSLFLGAIGDLENGEPVSIVLATRPEEVSRIQQAIRQHIPSESDYEHISISGLPIGDAVDLIRQLARVPLSPAAARRIADLANGNPFCLEEIVLGINARHTSTDLSVPYSEAQIEALRIPVRVEDMVMSRVARLDPDVREVLEALSVIGETFELAIADVVVGDSRKVRTAIEQLTDGNFVELSTTLPATTGRFRHNFRRFAVYQSLSKRRRTSLHGATAAALRASTANSLELHAALLAHHYAAAGAMAEAEEALLLAGTQAVRSAAGREALRHLERAQELYLARAGNDADQTHLRMLERNLGMARLLAGDLVGSIENFNAALRLLGMIVPKGKRRRDLFGVRDFLGAVSHIRFGLRRRPWLPKEQQQELFDILYNRCRAQNPTDAERSAFDNFAAIRQLAHLDSANVRGAASFYASAGAFFSFAGFDVLDLPGLAIQKAHSIEDPSDDGEAFEVASMDFVVRYFRGDWGDESLVRPESLSRAIDRGLSWNLDVYAGLACERHIKQGRFTEALEMLEYLRELQDRGGYTFAASNIAANTAYLHLERGEYDEALAAAEVFAAGRDEPTLRIIALSTKARAALGLGETKVAIEALAGAESLVRSARRVSPYYLSAYLATSLHADMAGAQMGQSGKGAKHTHKLVKAALRASRTFARDRPEIHRLAAVLARREGNTKSAREHAEAAWQEATALGMVPERERLGELFAGELRDVAPAIRPLTQ